MSPSQRFTVEVTTADDITHEYTMRVDELRSVPVSITAPDPAPLVLVEVEPEHRRGRPITMTITPEPRT